MPAPGWVASGVDRLLEASVVFGFTRVGFGLRRRLMPWPSLDSFDASGRTVVVTGPTSGIGRATALELARGGANVVLVGRDRNRTNATRDEIAAETGSTALSVVVADLGDLAAVRRAADMIVATGRGVDAIVHNAGTLSAEREEIDGIETTVAVQLVGPHLLTSLLVDALAASPDGRVVTVSSGGMYAAALTVDALEMGPDEYKGADQYARAKRAQVALTAEWAGRVPGVAFHAMHPGWVDTPGVAASLPRFRRLFGPLLRTPGQGADTVVWLVLADRAALGPSGGFWHDRRRRRVHRIRRTRASDTYEHRDRLWRHVAALAARG